MVIAVMLGRLTLAVIFVVAGFPKLFQLANWRRGLLDFGLPEALVGPLAIGLPAVEIATGLALLSGAWWASVSAVSLLTVFTCAVGLNLAHGRHPTCHCFGGLHERPIGWKTLIRNYGLLVVAVFLLSAERGSATLRGGNSVVLLTPISLWELLVAITLASVLTVGVLRQLGMLPVKGGLRVGVRAPSFSLTSLMDETVALESLRAGGKAALLTFIHPRCHLCNALLPELGRWQQELVGVINVVIVSQGSPEENRAKAAQHCLSNVLLQEANEVARAYHVLWYPSAVLVNPNGAVGSRVAKRAEEIRALVARIEQQPSVNSRVLSKGSLPLSASNDGRRVSGA